MTFVLRLLLALFGTTLLLADPSVAQTAALPSGKIDQDGWPLPRWWKKYRGALGRFFRRLEIMNRSALLTL